MPAQAAIVHVWCWAFFGGQVFFGSSHFCGACAMTARLEDELRLQLATTVSNISGLHPMFDDHWLTWVHNWSGSVTATNAGTRDPTAYSSAFLFDYLQHITSVDVIIRATEVSTPSFCYCFRCRRGSFLVAFWWYLVSWGGPRTPLGPLGDQSRIFHDF